jgi:hypothetical protein
MTTMAGNPTYASAAMPCVPLPPPKPALDHLPMELIGNILQYIPGPHQHELFALRSTCRFFRSVATNFLASDMTSRLRYIRVLLTKDGLTALLELMSVSNLKRLIQTVQFIDPGVDAIVHEKKGKQDRYSCLGYKHTFPQLETIKNKARYIS